MVRANGVCQEIWAKALIPKSLRCRLFYQKIKSDYTFQAMVIRGMAMLIFFIANGFIIPGKRGLCQGILVKKLTQTSSMHTSPRMAIASLYFQAIVQGA